MFDFILSFFNENVILLRTLMYTFGWTTLIMSTIALLYKAAQVRKMLKNSIFAKLIFPILLGWLATMWSLGAACTFYVYDLPEKGMIVTIPIFIVWTFTMVIVFFITAKLIKEAIKQYNEIVSLNIKLKEANINLKQLDKLKSEFITIAGHQLRTPLSEIKWTFSSLINGEIGTIADEQKQALEKGYQSNERIIKIINDLLNAEKTGNIDWGYNFKKESIVKIIEDAINNFSSLADKKNINLRLARPKNIIPNTEMDFMKINTVLNILIENAINYTLNAGEIVISPEYKNEYIQVSVKDTGIGIPQEEKERIFSRFFRGRNAVKVLTDGTGIGLSIAKNIINIHKGKIWLESEEGKGTIFYFTIPYKAYQGSTSI